MNCDWQKRSKMLIGQEALVKLQNAKVNLHPENRRKVVRHRLQAKVMLPLLQW